MPLSTLPDPPPSSKLKAALKPTTSQPQDTSETSMSNPATATPASPPRKPRRFAALGTSIAPATSIPINGEYENRNRNGDGDGDGDEDEDEVLKLRGVVFDMDGTLCEPQTYMFTQMRTALNIPPTTDILQHIDSLPTASARASAMTRIRTIESHAMELQKPQAGLDRLMSYLDRHGIPKALCTRNFEAPVKHLLENFLADHVLHPVVTRAFRPPKPAPEGIWYIAQVWAEGAEEVEDGLGLARSLIMVGDSLDDMTAGYRAGAATVLLLNDGNAHLATHEHTDLCIRQLDDLVEVLERGFVGRGDGEERMRLGKRDD